MRQETDVFVVGGGPAGLASAIAARQKGFRVTVADGAQPPIDKACGEGLLPEALEALRRMGISLGAAEGFALRGIRFVDPAGTVEAAFQGGCAFGVSRMRLHRKMVSQAEKSGVELRWGSTVSGVSTEGVTVNGEFVRAKWIVGADGGASRVRGWMGLDATKRLARRYAYRNHYRIAPWSEYTEVHWARGMQAYVTPIGTEEVCVVVIAGESGLRVEETLGAFPELRANLKNAERVGRERGAVTAMRQLWRVYRGNVALAGDASGGVDAITGEGLSLSFLQAEILAEAMANGRLESYQQRHRKLARRPTFMGRLLLLLDERPFLRRKTMRTLSANPELFARLLAIHTGETSPKEFAATGVLFGWHWLAA